MSPHPTCIHFVLNFRLSSNRYNLSFQENEDESDDSEIDSDEVCWPRFSEIKKVSGFLDKELAASGFTGKDQEDFGSRMEFL